HMGVLAGTDFFTVEVLTWRGLATYCVLFFIQDGDLEIDNGATERANRPIAIGRGNWTFFCSDNGGKTAAVLLSFIATCKRNAVEPFAWFRDVLTRVATHPISRIEELLPHNWKTLAAAAQV